MPAGHGVHAERASRRRAQRLFITQPALSRQIRGLERLVWVRPATNAIDEIGRFVRAVTSTPGESAARQPG